MTKSRLTIAPALWSKRGVLPWGTLRLDHILPQRTGSKLRWLWMTSIVLPTSNLLI